MTSTGVPSERVQDDVDRGAVGHIGHVLHGQDLADNTLVAVATGDLVALLDLTTLCDVHANLLVHAGSEVVAVLAAEAHDVDDAALGAVGHLEGGVADIVGLGAEDGTEQALLGGQRGLALWRDLTDQDVAGLDLGTDADDAVLVEVGEHVLGQVRDLAGDLLGAELGVTGIELVAGEVDGGEQVHGDEALGDDDTVLVVEALPRHVGHGQVLAEGKLAVIGGGAVGQGLAHELKPSHGM